MSNNLCIDFIALHGRFDLYKKRESGVTRKIVLQNRVLDVD